MKLTKLSAPLSQAHPPSPMPRHLPAHDGAVARHTRGAVRIPHALKRPHRQSRQGDVDLPEQGLAMEKNWDCQKNMENNIGKNVEKKTLGNTHDHHDLCLDWEKICQPKTVAIWVWRKRGVYWFLWGCLKPPDGMGHSFRSSGTSRGCTKSRNHEAYGQYNASVWKETPPANTNSKTRKGTRISKYLQCR